MHFFFDLLQFMAADNKSAGKTTAYNAFGQYGMTTNMVDGAIVQYDVPKNSWRRSGSHCNVNYEVCKYENIIIFNNFEK